MTYTSSVDFFKALKSHSCSNKMFLASDDPENDIYQAKVEGRNPTKYPTIGYTCQGCEDDFRINLQDIKKEPIDPDIEELLKSPNGRQKLGEFLSKI